MISDTWALLDNLINLDDEEIKEEKKLKLNRNSILDQKSTWSSFIRNEI